MATKNRSNELKLTRMYDAPVKMVWDAWTDPQQVAQWWGPRGFTLTTHSKELKPGGTWRYTMHGPDGKDWPNVTLYHEVVKHSKLVYDHGGSDDRPPLFKVTVIFTEIKNKTKMEMTMTLPTPEAAAEIEKFIKQAGGNSTWDRLGEFLEKESSGQEKFIINRSFDAPLHVMYEMWTDPKHVSQWLPPVGFKMEFLKSEIKPGSTTFYLMSNSDGVKLFGRAQYLDLQKPNRLVYTQQFCDEMENITRHPMLPTWPETMLTTVTLTEEGPEQTRVTVTWEPYGSTTPEEVRAFVNHKPSMTQGWTGSFDKLEDYLKK